MLRLPDNPTPQKLREWVVQRGFSGGSGRCMYVRHTGPKKGHTCGKAHIEYRCFGRLEDALVDEYGDELEVPNWLKLQGVGVDVYALDFVKINAVIYAMHATDLSAEGACYSCVPCDASVNAAAPGTSESVAALGASASAVTCASESATFAEALHTFRRNSGTSRCFFRNCTTLTSLAAPVPVSLADPSGLPVVARASTVLPCPAVPSNSLSGLHLPSFATNLVSNAALQGVWFDTFTPGGQRVAICQVAASSRVSSSGQLAASCSCRVLSHQTLLWYHRLGHPLLLRLRSMHSRLLVSGLPRSLPSLPCSPAPPCLPCVEGRQLAAPHSSEFPPTTAPLQTPHMDVWGLAPVGGTDQERYFLLATFTLPASPQQNGIAERRIGLIMEVARTYMIHAAASNFLWPFAVRYAAHQLNLWPRVSELETSPTLQWTGKAGDALVFRVWSALSLVRDAKASKLSSPTLRCVFLGFPTDALPWKFYHPLSCRIFSSKDITFDESICFYRLHPHASHLVDPPPLDEPVEISSDSSGPAEGGDPAADDTATTRCSPRLETPHGFPPRLSLPPQQPAAVDSEAATGGDTGGKGSRGAATGGADSGGATSPSGGGAEGDPAGGSPGGGGYGAAGIGAASPRGTAGAGGAGGTTGGIAGAGGIGGTAGGVGAASAGGAGGATGAGGIGVAGAGSTAGGARGAAGAGGSGAASARGTAGGAGGAVGAGGAGGAAGAGAAGAAGAGGAGGAAGAGGTGVASTGGAAGSGGAGAAGARGAASAGGVGVAAVGGVGLAGALRHLLGLPPAAIEFPVAGTTPHLLFPPADQYQPQLMPHSPLPAPAPYT
ncbi:unnamed protein product [Closterium sp. NIES-54]